MAREPFLINPPRRRRKNKAKRSLGRVGTIVRPRLKVTGKRKLKRGAHSPLQGWTINPKRRRKATGKRRRRNPFGSEVLLVGNPVKRRRRRNASKRRRSSYKTRRRNPIFSRRRHKKSSRRRRRNPLFKRTAASFPTINFTNPKTLILPIAVGVAAKMAVDKIPAMFGVSGGLMGYGAKIGVAFAGQFVATKALGKSAGNIFAIVAIASIGLDLMNEFVLGKFMPTLPVAPLKGLGYSLSPAAIGYDSDALGDDMGAYTVDSDMSAYVD